MADDGINDQVALRLGGDELVVATGWDIRQSVLQQPGEFNLRLGQGSTISTLINRYPPNTPFQLLVGGQLRMTGRTDGYRASAAGGNATELNIFGRDALAPMHDAHVAADRSFNDATYSSLVATVMKIVGLDATRLVVSGNGANRKLMTGVPVRELLPARTVDQILADVEPGEAGSATAPEAQRDLTAKAGQRWFEFVRHQLDRAGLMLWAAGDGTFVLTAPNANLAPSYRILRRRGLGRTDPGSAVNVVHADLLNDTRPRYTYALVYGKRKGGKGGRPPAKGDATDAEMVSLGYGSKIEVQQSRSGGGTGATLPARTVDQILNDAAKAGGGPGASAVKTVPGFARALVLRDVHCQNQAQAAFLCARKLAEARRHGYQLVYTLAGCSTPSLRGGAPAVWAPDTVVEVTDEEFGIEGMFYIETCEFRRQPFTTTTLRLMRVNDVIFGGAP